MFSWLGISAVNPLLLWGSAAIAAPIIIHLLARRKFRVVDWAAMEFLLDANRRNRRRIQLEHLILLLLRCLAVLLIALLVGRLFQQATGLASLIGPQPRTERLVLLDDSPSMRLSTAGKTVFERSTAALGDFVKQAARQRPGDTITLLRASQPDKPVIHGQYFDQADAVLKTIEQLEPSDVAADLPRALLAVGDLIDQAEEAGAGQVNRVVYIVSDLRRRDWPVAEDGERSLPLLLKQLGERTDGVVIVNMGSEAAMNLAVSDIEPQDKTIVAGVPGRYEVSVTNYGTREARDVAVSFTSGQAIPLVGHIDRLGPGSTASVPFAFTFAQPGSAALRAEIGPDELSIDNARTLVARVRQGVRVLVVDGDPSSEPARSETHFLGKALNPPGQSASGNVVEIITENQFQSADLTPYQVVFLANVYQITPAQRDALEAWVKNGGGLIIAPGDQVDAELHNEMLWRDGGGLAPAQLVQVEGDPSERQWVNLDLQKPNHPLLAVFSGQANPFLSRAKFFRYWSMTVAQERQTRGEATVLATFNDPAASVAIAERRFGDGRVVQLAMPLDGDWSTWVRASYMITMLELARYTARPEAEAGNLPVGAALVQPLDVAVHQGQALLRVPGREEPVTLAAAAEGEGASGMAFRYEPALAQGVYRLELKRHDGATDTVLFGAQIDPTEGDLAEAGASGLRRALGEAKVQLVEGAAYFQAGDEGGRAELWRGVLIALIAVLCAEQVLGFVFGRRR